MTDAFRRTLRTAVQVVLGLTAGAPLLVSTAGLPATLPGLGVVLAVAASITRLMALPLVNQKLPSWLKAAAPVTTVAPPAAVAALQAVDPGPASNV
jgi:hypothetical protein